MIFDPIPVDRKIQWNAPWHIGRGMLDRAGRTEKKIQKGHAWHISREIKS